MSYCKESGKDRIIFVTKEDHSIPSTVALNELDSNEGPRGLILPNGDINWNCPCLGGMASGPCGLSFRDAFSCFHYSEADPKGSDCIEKFTEMQECMNQFPNLYPVRDDTEEETDEEIEKRIMDELEKEVQQQNASTSDKTVDKSSDNENSLNKVNKT